MKNIIRNPMHQRLAKGESHSAVSSRQSTTGTAETSVDSDIMSLLDEVEMRMAFAEEEKVPAQDEGGKETDPEIVVKTEGRLATHCNGGSGGSQ